VVARAVLTALLDVSNIPKAVPTPGTSPRAATTVPAASFPALERLLPTRPLVLRRPVTAALLRRLGFIFSVSDSRTRDSSWQALLQRQSERTREPVVERSAESLSEAWFQEAEPARGFEPLTRGLRNRRSTTELRWLARLGFQKVALIPRYWLRKPLPGGLRPAGQLRPSACRLLYAGRYPL
jgi:hypothetical protein